MENFELTQLAAIGVALAVAIYGMWGVLSVLKRTQKGFGVTSSRTFAISIFVPVVVIVAAATDLSTEAIAALLGTLAGYIFAKSDNDS